MAPIHGYSQETCNWWMTITPTISCRTDETPEGRFSIDLHGPVTGCQKVFQLPETSLTSIYPQCPAFQGLTRTVGPLKDRYLRAGERILVVRLNHCRGNRASMSDKTTCCVGSWAFANDRMHRGPRSTSVDMHCNWVVGQQLKRSSLLYGPKCNTQDGRSSFKLGRRPGGSSWRAQPALLTMWNLPP